jgi:hypothetical protein
MNEDTSIVHLRQPDEIDDPLTALLRSGARRLLEQAIEAEVEAFLASRKDLKLADGRDRLVRHGHGPERVIQTGTVEVQRIKVRDRAVEPACERIRFSSALLPRWARRTTSLDALLPILYLRGVSAGDFQEALGVQALSPLSAELGKDAPNLSPSVIARLKESWADDYARWQKRDLSARRYVYVWADGVYLQARMEPVADCMLVMIGATPEGKKELLGFQVGVRESSQSWHELLIDLKARGLTIAPELAVADGALGFWKALDEIFPGTKHQRCWFHTIRTQSDIRLGRGVAPRRGTMQRDDMSDLQIVLTDDDPLDDELQDDLPILECSFLQSLSDAITKGGEARHYFLSMGVLLTQPLDLLQFLRQGSLLIRQMSTALGKLVEFENTGLVGINQPAIGL